MNDDRLDGGLRRVFAQLPPPPGDLGGRVRDYVVERRPVRRVGAMAAGTATAVALAAILASAVGMRPHGPGPAGPSRAAAASTPTAPAVASPTPSPTPTAPPTTMAAATPAPTPIPTKTAAATPVPTATPRPDCTAAEVSVAVRTDASSYTPGRHVIITSTITNTSHSVCEGSGVGATFRILDASGAQVYQCLAPGVVAPSGGIPWSSGQTYTNQCDWAQDVQHSDGSTSPAAAGTYTVKVLWSGVPGLSSSGTSFSLIAA